MWMPVKNKAGQGFGSATGQYLDLYIKFDTRTLTGYALRIIRTTKYSKMRLILFLMKYENRVAEAIVNRCLHLLSYKLYSDIDC